MLHWSLDDSLDPPLWRPRSESGAIAAFTTRRGGVSAPPYHALNLGRSTEDARESVENNRARVLKALGLDPARLATAGQVHGRVVKRVTAPGLHAECDALVTREPRLPLAVSGADCLPILFVARGAVGAAHAGWRGVAAGVPLATLEAVSALAEVPAHEVDIHFGPCIRSCCYEVGPEVAVRFPGETVRHFGSSLRLSVPDAARGQLLAGGAAPERLFDTGACTACEPWWYFSHRRDRGRTGRQWGLIALAGGRTEPSGAPPAARGAEV